MKFLENDYWVAVYMHNGRPKGPGRYDNVGLYSTAGKASSAGGGPEYCNVFKVRIVIDPQGR